MAGWYADWWERKEWIERNGRPVIIQEARVQDDFVAIYLEADEAYLPRSHGSRGFPLHVSLGFLDDYPEGVAAMLCEFVNAQRAQQYYVLDIEWVGHGGAAMIRGMDPFALDPLIKLLHANGYYGARQLHVSL